jgi:16S rRNA (guanine(966)-N(2))-methyltransferase RsmD
MSKYQSTVIAGKYRGKKIDLPSLQTTRSSKSIVKESYFNTIQNDVIDCNFVELFAGSGSIGIEALSRGAGHAYFMEKDQNAFKTLRKNIKSLGEENATLIEGNSFSTIDQVIKTLSRANETAYFYVDPPFSLREGMEEIYNKTFEMLASIPAKMVEMITIEHMTGLELPEKVGSLRLKKSKKFGKTSLSHYL